MFSFPKSIPKWYPNWYRIAEVKFHMIRYTYKRETMLIPPKHSVSGGKTTRMIKIHNVQHLDLWLQSMHIADSKKDYNMYYSLAKYKDGIPHGSLNLSERDFGNWNEDHWKEMESYDFVIDVDAGNHKEIEFAYYSAVKVKKFFDELNVPYNLRFSGMGFHFLIPYNYFSDLKMDLSFDPDSEHSIYNLYNSIANKLHKKFSEMVDVTIYDSRRVIKIPYSLAMYSSGNFICMPFYSDEEFDKFYYKHYRPIDLFSKINRSPEKLFNINGNLFKLLKEMREG